MPSALRPPCTIVDADTLEDDWVSAYLTLVDLDGNRLGCWWGEDGIILSGRDHALIHTKPGDAEEQVLLKIVKQSFAKIYDPALDRKDYFDRHPSEAPDYHWFTQHAIERFIRGLEYRCVHKKLETWSGG